MHLGGARKLGSVLALLTAASACGVSQRSEPPKVAPPVAVAAAIVEVPAPVPLPEAPATVEFASEWKGFGVGKCSYLAPRSKRDFVAEDGAVDIVFHFHAGQMSQRELKDSGIRAVFVSCGYGIGTGGYSSAFQDPNRFGWMVGRLMKTLGKDAGEPVHLGRLALASWSAGFASISRILSVPEWYAKTDAVILLDGLHAQYTSPPEPRAGITAPGRAAQGVARVDTRMLKQFVRYAGDAATGTKTMVITHSSIVPPDYASVAESTAALLGEVGVAPCSSATATSPTTRPCDPAHDSRWAPAMGIPIVVADEGGLHVRGYRGMGPHDHFDHLHRIGDALRSWLVPRWYTPSSERR